MHKLIEGERRRLLDENTKLRQELQERYDLRNIVGNSRPMQQVYEQVAQVAPTNTTVLIRGESRHRQGARGPRHPLQLAAGARSPS